MEGGQPPLAEFLQTLARAVRQFRTYPPTSPLCVDAIRACHAAFDAADPPSPLLVRVTSRELIVGDVEIGRGTPIEQELARPLHRARVASVEVDRAVSPREWSRFCADLARLPRLAGTKTTLAELLVDGGVATIVARTTPRPEVLQMGAPAPAVCNLVERERARRASAAAAGPAQYFYPPEKGWVRFDPSSRFDTVSLVDLAVLVDDPTELAAILMRLTDDDAEAPVGAAAAIEQKYGDLITVLSALDPRLARILFSKLARAVLQLEPDRRKALLRRAILPGLLDGRADAEAILSDFPDVDLADALCLLLDLETAAPEVLGAALDRLSLPGDRRAALVPIIRQQLAAGGHDRADGRALDSYAGALVRVARGEGKSFADFAAFDLAIDAPTSAALDWVRQAIAATDTVDAQLACLADLVRLEANPVLVAALVDRASALLQTMVHDGRWQAFTRWMAALGATAAAARQTRPDAAAAIDAALERLVDRDLVVALAARSERSAEDRQQVDMLLGALGPAVVRAWAAALDRPADHPRVRPLAAALSARATDLGSALAAELAGAGLPAARAIVTTLGFARGRHEPALLAALERGDDTLTREALRALARIGSREAAAIVAGRLVGGTAAGRAAAEEAIWRLPQPLAVAMVRDLLADRAFVLSDPKLAARLLDRAARSRTVNLNPVLAQLVPLRFRFWNPALVRIATRAKELQQ